MIANAFEFCSFSDNIVNGFYFYLHLAVSGDHTRKTISLNIVLNKWFCCFLVNLQVYLSVDKNENAQNNTGSTHALLPFNLCWWVVTICSVFDSY